MSSEPQRLTVVFEGHVQGVGFRYTVQRLASNYAVTGYVKNTDDGNVELVVEGDRAILDEFVKSISSYMTRYIRNMHIRVDAYIGDLTKFRVAF